MSSSGGTTSELRGYSEADDVTTLEDAQNLFGLSPPIDEDEISETYTELTLEYHPDTGGTTELFQAIERAHDYLTGERQPEEVTGKARGQQKDAATPDEEPESDTFTGGVGGTSSKDFERLVELVKDILKQGRGVNPEIDSLIDQYGMDEVAGLMARLILNGNIDLGDIDKMVGKGGDPRFSGARGGDDRFGRGGGAGDSRFGGGDSRFG